MTTKTKKESSPDEEGVNRHRVQLDFSPEAYERLSRIRSRSDAATNAEVVSNALRLWQRSLNPPYSFLKEMCRIIIGVRLDILRKCDCYRSRIYRIGKHTHGIRQGGEKMFRT